MIIIKLFSDMFWRVIKSILRFFGFRYASGQVIVISNSSKNIRILTGFTPKRVWIYPHTPHGVPSCGSNLDSFDIYIIPDGFALFVTLENESREFDWIAEG